MTAAEKLTHAIAKASQCRHDRRNNPDDNPPAASFAVG